MRSRCGVINARLPQSTQADSNKKLFRETVFTDFKTANQIGQNDSDVAMRFPSSPIERQILYSSHISILNAVLSSSADPIYVGPATIGGKTYFTGAIDIDPLPLAKGLAKEVWTSYPSPFEPLFEETLFKAVFGYEVNDYLKIISNSDVTRWIDIANEEIPNLAPYGRFKIFESFKNLAPSRSIQIGSNVPTDHSKYVDIVEAQYRFGYSRTLEALKSTKGSKAHIRKKLF